MARNNAVGILGSTVPPDSDYLQAWWAAWDAQYAGGQSTAAFEAKRSRQAQGVMSQHEIGDESRQIYVFSPKGEAYLLDDGCTALDYAYTIHSDVADHAASVLVNGERAHYSTKLTCGDLIDIVYDERFSGPDLSWNDFVTTPKT